MTQSEINFFFAIREDVFFINILEKTTIYECDYDNDQVEIYERLSDFKTEITENITVLSKSDRDFYINRVLSKVKNEIIYSEIEFTEEQWLQLSNKTATPELKYRFAVVWSANEFIKRIKADLIEFLENLKELNGNNKNESSVILLVNALSYETYKPQKTFISNEFKQYFIDILTNKNAVVGVKRWDQSIWMLYALFEFFISNQVITWLSVEDVPEFLLKHFTSSGKFEKRSIKDDYNRAKKNQLNDSIYKTYTAKLREVYSSL